jgi:hypothetical protein
MSISAWIEVKRCDGTPNRSRAAGHSNQYQILNENIEEENDNGQQ